MQYWNGVQHPYGLVHHQNDKQVYHFFWTEFTDGVIKRFDSDNNKTTIIRQESVPLFDMRLYGKMLQRGVLLMLCSFLSLVLGGFVLYGEL